MVFLLANYLLLLRRIVSSEVLLDAKYSLVQGSTGVTALAESGSYSRRCGRRRAHVTLT